MSWITITLLVLAAFFLCAFGLSEWIVKRRASYHANGRDGSKA